MSSELQIDAVHTGGMKTIASNGVHEVVADYPLEQGQAAAGMKPLELLPVSLAACVGSVVALLLRRMGQPVTRLEVVARGNRRDQHPTLLTDLSAKFLVHGAGVDAEAVSTAIVQADEKLWPVWAMLKPNAAMTTSYVVEG
jgi:putative redox protein